MKIESVGKSDLGLSRKINEDCFFASPDKQLFIVADGMGGHAAGEVASRLAVDVILESLYPEDKSTPGGATELVDRRKLRAEDRVQRAIQSANQRIFQKAVEKDNLEGMGTTVVALLVEDNFVVIAHVGDSRAYRLRDESIEQLTEDHSLVSEQLKQKVLTEEEAEASQFKNIITRALGSEETVKVDIQRQELKKDDYFLLSTDGLTALLNSGEIRDIILNAEGNLELAADNLIGLANERGGGDNITVVIFRIRELTEGIRSEEISPPREKPSVESSPTEIISVRQPALKVPVRKIPVKLTLMLVAFTVIFLTIVLSIAKFRAGQRAGIEAERGLIIAQGERKKAEEATLAKLEKRRRQAEESLSEAKKAGAVLYALMEWKEAGEAFRQAGDSLRDKDYQAAAAQLTKSIERSRQAGEKASEAGKAASVINEAGETLKKAKGAGIENYSGALSFIAKAEETFTQAELTFKIGKYKQSLKLAKETMDQVKEENLALLNQEEKVKLEMKKSAEIALARARESVSEAEKSGGLRYARTRWMEARDLLQQSQKAFGQGNFRESIESAKKAGKQSGRTINSVKARARAAIEKAETRFEQAKEIAKNYAPGKLTAARENLNQAKTSLAAKDFPAAIRKSKKAFASAEEAEQIAREKVRAAREAAFSWVPETVSYIDDILPRLSLAVESIKRGRSSDAKVILTERLPDLFRRVVEVKGLPDTVIKTMEEMGEKCKVKKGWSVKLPSPTALNEVRTTLQNLKERLHKEYGFDSAGSLNSP